MKQLRSIFSLALCLTLLANTAAAFDTSRDSGLLTLVNKSHPVAETYIPELVEFDSVQLREEAASALETMLQAMEAAGIPTCNVISGYRSYEYQLQLVTEKVERRVANGQSRDTAYQQVTMSTAPAGCSEHQLGLAIDFSTGTTTSVTFSNTAAGVWLKENAWKYGFILRYQDGKIPFTNIVSEPWHYRYIGTPHAQIIHENGWCYEEYITYLRENGSYSLMIGDEIYNIYRTEDTTTEYTNILDISSDNDGGWIITTGSIADPLYKARGHWSESAFAALLERGVSFTTRIDPRATITCGEFAALCSLAQPADPNAPLTRQNAAVLLAPALASRTLTFLFYSDLDAISGSAFQSVQMCVAAGIFTHSTGASFRPMDVMTWGEAATTALRYLNTLPTPEEGTSDEPDRKTGEEDAAENGETTENENTAENNTENTDLT